MADAAPQGLRRRRPGLRVPEPAMQQFVVDAHQRGLALQKPQQRETVPGQQPDAAAWQWLPLAGQLGLAVALLLVVLAVIHATPPPARENVPTTEPVFEPPDLPGLVPDLNIPGIQCQMEKIDPLLRRADRRQSPMLPTPAELDSVRDAFSSLRSLELAAVRDTQTALELLHTSKNRLSALTANPCTKEARLERDELLLVLEAEKEKLALIYKADAAKLEGMLLEVRGGVPGLCSNVQLASIYGGGGGGGGDALATNKDAFTSLRGLCMTIQLGVRSWEQCYRQGWGRSRPGCHEKTQAGGVIQRMQDISEEELGKLSEHVKEVRSPCSIFSGWF